MAFKGSNQLAKGIYSTVLLLRDPRVLCAITNVFDIGGTKKPKCAHDSFNLSDLPFCRDLNWSTSDWIFFCTTAASFSIIAKCLISISIRSDGKINQTANGNIFFCSDALGNCSHATVVWQFWPELCGERANVLLNAIYADSTSKPWRWLFFDSSRVSIIFNMQTNRGKS